MKASFQALTLAIILTISGCEIIDINDLIPDDKDNNSPEETTALPSYPIGDTRLLWKPVSESNGNLMILTPSNYPDPIQRHYWTIQPSAPCITGLTILYNNTSETCSPRPCGNTHTGDKTLNPNGNRPHWYADHPGAAYGQNVTVIIFLENGAQREYNIPDGAGRWEGNKNPLKCL